ncbi:glycosyltransferase [Anaeroselena agilis]|uniref:Glycosyltransferase n=1 Tax=Anaeroselena agilis TaxID=3063788 RepID=A0ABU3P3B0_9FIRM|nr:glycosyltransferase [Selenomonadales bacterium 4137-cl]
MFLSYHGDPLAKLGGIQSGGQNIYVKEVVTALERLGFAADVFTHWSDPEAPQVEVLGKKSRVIRLEAGKKGFFPKQRMYAMIPHFISELTAFIRSPDKYSLIHSNYWLSGYIGQHLRSRYGLPLVHTSHSLGVIRSNAMEQNRTRAVTIRLDTEKRLLRTADCVVATTPDEQEVLRDYYGVAPDKVSLVPCGVNTGVFHPHTKTVADRRNTLLFAGRFEENKGLSVLLKAMAALKANRPQTMKSVRLLICGGDPLDLPESAVSAEKCRYRKFIDENALTDCVEFLGPLKHEGLAQCFSMARATVVPSYYESFGLVALEAMACGCPVIASNTGGLRHTVLDGITGILVEPKDPAMLADAIYELLTNDYLSTRMRKDTALHARRYSWLQVASDLTKIYREVVECRKETPSIRQNIY